MFIFAVNILNCRLSVKKGRGGLGNQTEADMGNAEGCRKKDACSIDSEKSKKKYSIKGVSDESRREVVKNPKQAGFLYEQPLNRSQKVK